MYIIVRCVKLQVKCLTMLNLVSFRFSRKIQYKTKTRINTHSNISKCCSSYVTEVNKSEYL